MRRTSWTTRVGGAGRWRPVPLLALCLLAGGCSLFEARESEAPEGSSVVDWSPPISPDAVLANLDAVVEALDPNLYEELLADSGWSASYRFLGDAATGGDRVWTLDAELSSWQRLVDHYSAVQTFPRLALARTDSTLLGDSASYTADYLLEFPAAVDRPRERYAGILRLALSRSRDTGNWAIHRWEDQGSDSLPSWTQLKQAFLW